MRRVRTARAEEVDDVVRRVATELARDAQRHEVDGALDHEGLAAAFTSVLGDLFLVEDGGRLSGHLVANVLDDPVHGRGAWVGPDGVSFDLPEDLEALYAHAGQHWIERGALDHFVWVLDEPLRVAPWLELAFSRMHQRGVADLSSVTPTPLPRGLSLRRATGDDLEAVVGLSRALDLAQAAGPSFSRLDTSDEREELREALDDPDVTTYLIVADDQPIGQCLAFALDPRRGTHPGTVHLSAVSVAEAWRDRGVGTALVSKVLAEARAEGYRWAETNWRVAHRGAARFWPRQGFVPTWVRLHRRIGSG